MEHVLFTTSFSVTGFEVLATSVILLFGLTFISGVSALSRLEKTIKRKDFSMKPQYDKHSGELQWARPTPIYDW